MKDKVFSKGFFKYIVEDGKACLCSYRGFKKLLIIPETLSGYPVTSMWQGEKACAKRL